MLGFVSEQESDKLRQCLLDIAESDIPGLYYESEKHLLTRVWLSCCGSRCLKRCKNSRNFSEHDARDIYAIHCRLPKKEPVVKECLTTEPKKQAIIDRVKAVKKASPWMS